MKLRGTRIMTSLALAIAVGCIVSLAGMTTAWADTAKDEKTLAKESAEIDKTAGQPQGGAVVVQKLETEFGVTESQITALRDKKMGYGEIAIIFSLAKQLGGAGGITQANIDAIVAKRLGPPVMGWGQVAKSYNLKLGPVVSDVKKAETASAKEMKHTEKTEKTERTKTENMNKEQHGGVSDRAGGMEHSGGHGRY